MNKFYITTPIYYSNDVPHIGHTGTTVFADIIARHKRNMGADVFFLTGTDEHGEKVALAAKKANMDPQKFVDNLAVKWQDYWAKLNISNDKFIRTTMPRHAEVASNLLVKLRDNGDIENGMYKGIYCVGCEEFKASRDLVDGKCPEHRPDQIQFKEEKNYFFKFSRYVPKVKSLIESDRLPIIPQNKKSEMVSKIDTWIKSSDGDISISRQDVKWGIPVPWDKSQTIYVWVEALMNYYSATKIWDREEFWPTDVHFLGKGNNWFHSVIWPALLLALDLPLPRKIFVHGYYNVEGKKMGKSLGNVISPRDLIDKYGVDGTRYLLAASMPYENDSDVSFPWFSDKYNSDLANGLGNLVSRVAKMSEGLSFKVNMKMKYKDVLSEFPKINRRYDEFRLHEVIGEIQLLVRSINEYLDQTKPWKKEGEERKEILQKSAQKIVQIAYLADPIVPEAAQRIKRIFTAETIKPTEPLFYRV